MIVFEITEASVAWKRQGNKVTRKYRCTSGPRKGQVRASPASCNAPINIKKRNTLKKTKQKIGSHGTFRQQQTKRRNPASRRLTTLNKPRRRSAR
jgi:hypothetical protein